MSREIKFRCWDKWTKQMHITLSIDFKDTHSSERGSLILMQYTGLKDSNGVEIYEGDILVVKDKEFGDSYSFVSFKDGSFVVEEKGFVYSMPLSDLLTLKPSITGNVYKNPELMEE